MFKGLAFGGPFSVIVAQLTDAVAATGAAKLKLPGLLE
jgi:hypothetical protein